MNNKNHKTKYGFSLLEMIIVISIFSIAAAASFATFNESRNRAVLEDAQASIINALEQTRTQSATGVGTENHGVRINENEIVILEGSADQNEVSLPAGVSTNLSDLEIIFDRISAKTNITDDIVITLTHILSGVTKTITITPNGRIIKQ